MSSPARKTSVFDSAQYDYLYLHNSGNENVPIYTGDQNALNPDSNGLGVVIRFKANGMTTKLLGHLVPKQCVKIRMVQDAVGFLEVITISELYKDYMKKNPRHLFRQIAPR